MTVGGGQHQGDRADGLEEVAAVDGARRDWEQQPAPARGRDSEVVGGRRGGPDVTHRTNRFGVGKSDLRRARDDRSVRL
jgi:hypothetical protein